ncbi:MAG: tetratricopeptide repeat protein, partial [Myxococcota bacterium]|nr:tetratricopeptide repeat protein [Myxococcota bacterium]
VASPSPGAPGTAASAVPATSGAASATELSAPDPRAAAKAKTAATSALERGNLAAAVEAGERSVALDPTDGEAWLILGAAYQQKGDTRGAVRSFKACLQQGKRGPKSECAAMLR